MNPQDDKRRVKEILASWSCPFCTGSFSVVEDLDTRTPMVLHSTPLACETFERLDVTSYVAAVNRALEDGPLRIRPITLQTRPQPPAEDHVTNFYPTLALGTAERRMAFAHRLRARLAPSGVSLVGWTRGRESGAAGARSVWILTVILPNQHVLTMHAPLPDCQDVFASEVVQSVGDRVLRYLQDQQLIASPRPS